MRGPEDAAEENTMEATLHHSLMRLDTQQLLSIDSAYGRCVVVFGGRVWITQHGDPKDHILQTGESFTFDRPGLAIIEALAPSSLVVLAEPARAPEPIGYEAAWPVTEPARHVWSLGSGPPLADPMARQAA
jgi:Protein of unknown function (DUF2917)